MPTEKTLTDFVADNPLPTDDDWTWMDNDRDVAWGDPESYHGRLATIYQTAGWEVCYHDYGRTVFHINAKNYGNWSLERDIIADVADSHDMKWDDVARIAQGIHENEMEWWWEQLTGGVEYLFAEERRETGLTRDDVWSDGRQGGWLHVSNSWAATHPEEMILLAYHVQESLDYYKSQDWYDYLKEMIEERIADDPDAGKERCHCCGQIKESA